MRFNRIAIHGLGPFRGTAEVDLASVPGRVVAVAGGNGQGKSTLLELLPGALYRETPTRGTLAVLATGRDSWVEVDVVNGARYRIRHTVDAATGKGESLVLDEGGRPVLASAKVREFDGWAASHLPAPEVLYASTFAPQGSGGFLELKPGDRKAVLLRVLGIERLEKLAQDARERARGAKARLDVVVARMADLDGPRVADAQDELKRALGAAATADIALASARKALDELRMEVAEAEATRKAADEKRALRGRKLAELNAANTKLAELVKRRDNNLMVLARADAIRGAVARDQELAEELRQCQARAEQSRRDAGQAERDRAAHEKLLAGARGRADVASRRAEAARARLRGRDEVEAAVERVPCLLNFVNDSEAAASQAEAVLENLRGQRVAGADDRIRDLRSALWCIDSGKAANPRQVAREALEEDDDAIRAAEELPERISHATSKVAIARRGLEAARQDLAAAQRMADRAHEIEHAESEMMAAEHDQRTAEREVELDQSIVDHACERAKQAKAMAQPIEARIAEVVEERAGLATLLAFVPRLSQAEARVSELQPQIDAEETRAAVLQVEIDAMAIPAAAPLPPDVRPAEAEVARLEAESRRLHGAVGVHVRMVEDAKTREVKAEALQSERTAIDAELADWERLAQDLGRDGLQALEIDAAGPELTELINDLLRTCVGSRWTVSVETTRLSADGKKQIEGCDVRVLDTERGRDAQAESLSGGERVIVGEAISLALSMLACRRSGVQGATLVRDETGAALDPANGRAYVAMLRRAADIVGASKVLFVSHSQDVQDLADSRIVIRNGEVTIQ